MNVRHEFLPCPETIDVRGQNTGRAVPSRTAGRLRSVLGTAVALAALWAGFHGSDPASWVIGVPVVVMGSAAILLLPAGPSPRLSVTGMMRFSAFALWGVLRGAVDVSRRSLAPGSLRPGCMTYRTNLPDGRPQRLFALAITLLPGTLTARLEGTTLTVHALDPGAETYADLVTLEQRVAGLFGLTTKEMDT